MSGCCRNGSPTGWAMAMRPASWPSSRRPTMRGPAPSAGGWRTARGPACTGKAGRFLTARRGILWKELFITIINTSGSMGTDDDAAGTGAEGAGNKSARRNGRGPSPDRHCKPEDDAGLAGAAGQLLFRDLHQAAGDVAPDGAGVARGHVAHIAVLRNLDAQLLRDFVLQLVKRRGGLRDDKNVAGTGLSCCHDVFTSLPLVVLLCAGESGATQGTDGSGRRGGIVNRGAKKSPTTVKE